MIADPEAVTEVLWADLLSFIPHGLHSVQSYLVNLKNKFWHTESVHFHGAIIAFNK